MAFSRPSDATCSRSSSGSPLPTYRRARLRASGSIRSTSSARAAASPCSCQRRRSARTSSAVCTDRPPPLEQCCLSIVACLNARAKVVSPGQRGSGIISVRGIWRAKMGRRSARRASRSSPGSRGSDCGPGSAATGSPSRAGWRRGRGATRSRTSQRVVAVRHAATAGVPLPRGDHAHRRRAGRGAARGRDARRAGRPAAGAGRRAVRPRADPGRVRQRDAPRHPRRAAARATSSPRRVPAFAGTPCENALLRLFATDAGPAEAHHPAWGGHTRHVARSSLFRLPAAPGARAARRHARPRGRRRARRAGGPRGAAARGRGPPPHARPPRPVARRASRSSRRRSRPSPSRRPRSPTSLDVIVRQTRAVDAALAEHGTGRLTIERSLRGMLGRAGVTVAAHPQLARGAARRRPGVARRGGARGARRARGPAGVRRAGRGRRRAARDCSCSRPRPRSRSTPTAAACCARSRPRWGSRCCATGSWRSCARRRGSVAAGSRPLSPPRGRRVLAAGPRDRAQPRDRLADDPRDLHLRDADALADLRLREVLLEAQAQDLALARRDRRA